MKAKEFIPATKPRNFVAKNQQTAGAGQHKDKKRAEKQGDVKHKAKQYAEGVAEGSDDNDTAKAAYIYGLRHGREGVGNNMDRAKAEWGDNFKYYNAGFLKGRNQTAKSLKAVGQGYGNRQQGVAEGSDFGEPREILENVLQTLEREVEWPLTEVMDPREVGQLLAPIIRAVNDKMLSMEASLEEAPIEMDPADPMDPMIYGHDKANPAKLKYRMLRAAGQLKNLAARADGASPGEWELMARQFDELKMNMEQIRHALDELSRIKRKGGIRSRGINL